MEIDWIREGLKGQGKSQRGLAQALGINPSGVSRLLAGARALKLDEIGKIVAYLGTAPRGWTVTTAGLEPAGIFGAALLEPGSLGNAEGEPSPEAGSSIGRAQHDLPALHGLSRDLPVLGTAVGGDGGRFDFNGEVVDYVRRPPGLDHAQGAFAIYVQGDSMAPRYEEGELVFVHPGRPPRPGCDVVVELVGSEGEPGQSLLKRLLRRTADRLELSQFNPPKEFSVPLKKVKAVYRILSAAELLGV